MSEDCTYFESCVFDQTSIVLKSFQLQITASVCERQLRVGYMGAVFVAHVALNLLV